MRHPPACSNQVASEHLRRLPHPLPTWYFHVPPLCQPRQAERENGQGRERQCLTASPFDPEPMRGSLAGMPAGISGGQRITSARSCSTIRAMPWPHAVNSAIYARATLQASTSNSRKTTNLRRTNSARLVLHRQRRGHQQITGPQIPDRRQRYQQRPPPDSPVGAASVAELKFRIRFPPGESRANQWFPNSGAGRTSIRSTPGFAWRSGYRCASRSTKCLPAYASSPA